MQRACHNEGTGLKVRRKRAWLFILAGIFGLILMTNKGEVLEPVNREHSSAVME